MFAFLMFDFSCSILSREIGWKERLQNDLFSSGWDVKVKP